MNSQEEKDLRLAEAITAIPAPILNDINDIETRREIALAKKIESKRDYAEIRRLIFAGIISGMLFLIALAMRDFITETIYSFYPKDSFWTRLMAFIIVVFIAIIIVIIVYYEELDL